MFVLCWKRLKSMTRSHFGSRSKPPQQVLFCNIRSRLLLPFLSAGIRLCSSLASLPTQCFDGKTENTATGGNVTKWERMEILFVSNEPWSPAMLEACLIDRYEGALQAFSVRSW